MKKLFTLFVAAGIGFTLSAQQLNNAGFETWTSPSNPDGWATWESALGAPLGLATKDTTVKAQGTASVKIKTDSVQAGPTKRLIPGFVHYGSAVYAPPAPLQLKEAAFAGKPDSIFFLFKYAPAGSDSASIVLSMSGPSGLSYVGSSTLGTTSGNWISITLTADGQVPAGTVDSLALTFSSSKGGGIAGSVLNVDAIRFGYVATNVGIQKLADDIKLAVYPNPVADLLKIDFTNNESELFFEMTDALGRVVLTETLTSKSTIDVSKIENGNYFYRISSAGIVIKSDGLLIAK
jgi:hypothetical protein